jgi:hypothetical protein
MPIRPVRHALVLVLATLCLSAPAKADGTAVISDADAKSHVGETGKVEGVVTKVSVGKSGTVFLNFGDAFPKQSFTAMIPADQKKSFGDVKRFEGQKVAVNGKIQTYRDKPEIVVSKPEQIEAAP